MKREIFQEIKIPEGIEVKLENNLLTFKGNLGEIKREFNTSKLILENKDGKISVGSKTASKNEKRRINTIAAHIANMVKGVTEGYEYKLKVANSHFPMNVEVKGKEAVIKNFLGEKVPRKLKILDNVKVDIDRDVITVSSTDKELAGQTAANFEKATRIRLRDRRVFQDGIFITSKAGKEI
jgi:large subunit ribosomal protein L6